MILFFYLLLCNSIDFLMTSYMTLFVSPSDIYFVLSTFHTFSFSVAENIYSFGPLHIFEKAESRLLISDNNTTLGPALTDGKNNAQLQLQLQQSNSDIMRLTNDGRFKCSITLTFQDSDNIFFIDPTHVELEENETAEVRVWAFPTQVQEYKNTIIATISLNPNPLFFPISCYGSSPEVQFDGSWTENLQITESALAVCVDKKSIKELESKISLYKECSTIDFGRILIGKSDVRTFEIRNTSSLMVAWEIILNDFTESLYLNITPLKGIIAVNCSQSVTLSFSSSMPCMLVGKFSVRYSDIEGGLEVPAR
jgi:hypothetical protein